MAIYPSKRKKYGPVPTGNVNLGTFSTNGTVTNQNVYDYATASFTVAVPHPEHVTTYGPSQGLTENKSDNDMGQVHAYRYVNTSGMYNVNEGVADKTESEITTNGDHTVTGLTKNTGVKIRVNVSGGSPTGNKYLGTFQTNGLISNLNVAGYATASLLIEVEPTPTETLLWQNSDTSTELGNTTITLSESLRDSNSNPKFDYIKFVTLHYPPTYMKESNVIMALSDFFECAEGSSVTSTSQHIYVTNGENMRRVFYISDTQIKFTGKDGSTTKTVRVMPYKIYGIKYS